MPNSDELRNINRTLERIQGDLHAPFRDIQEQTRYTNALQVQSLQHKEMLELQEKNNKSMLAEQSKVILWTKVLAFATIGLAVATIILVFVTK